MPPGLLRPSRQPAAAELTIEYQQRRERMLYELARNDAVRVDVRDIERAAVSAPHVGVLSQPNEEDAGPPLWTGGGRPSATAVRSSCGKQLVLLTVLPALLAGQPVTRTDHRDAWHAPVSRAATVALVRGPGSRGFDDMESRERGFATTSSSWRLARTALIVEASVAALSSAGYVADAFGEPAEGASVISFVLGLTGGLCMVAALATEADASARRGPRIGYVVCGGLLVVSAYNYFALYERKAGAARIFNHNMIGLNAVPLLTWGAWLVFRRPS